MALGSQNLSKVSLLKGGDIFLMVLIVSAFVFSIHHFSRGDSAISSVTISHGSKLLHTLPLKDTLLEVEGDLGLLTIVIRDRTVSVIESSCPHQICAHTPPLKKSGGIICIPNRISVDAHGEEGGVDATVR